jgi:hypothetical protein
MSKIQCQHCEEKFTAEDRGEMLKIFYTHYMKEHTAVITTVDDAGKKAWMEAFEAQWSAAQEAI